MNLENADIQQNGQTINITLPDAEILSNEINQDSVQVLDEINNVFNPIQVEDFASFESQEKTKMEEKAVENGLLDQAKANAKSSVEELMTRRRTRRR